MAKRRVMEKWAAVYGKMADIVNENRNRAGRKEESAEKKLAGQIAAEKKIVC